MSPAATTRVVAHAPNVEIVSGGIVGRVGDWLRRHPTVVDVVIALAVTALALPTLFLYDDYVTFEVHEPDALGVGLVLAACLPLMWRRRRPLVVTVIVAVASSFLMALNYPADAAVGTLIGVYTAAAYAPQRHALVAAAVAAVSFVVPVPFHDYPLEAANLVAVACLLFAAYAFGRSIGFRRAYTTQLELRAAGLEAARVGELREVVAEERARIARELHDVVAHHVSVMTVQASAARRMLERDPVRSADAMAAVETTGRAAMHEMRRLVGVLRADGEHAPNGLVPQPGVDDLADLVAQVRNAGLGVTVSVEGVQRSLPSGVGLAVYRIVQEGLTNTLKHAGRTHAHVTLTYADDHVAVTVLDRGCTGAPGHFPKPEQRTGHGVPGMRERVALYGGDLAVGAVPGGGFRVAARIPVQREEQTPAGSSAAGADAIRPFASAGRDRLDEPDDVVIPGPATA